MSPIIDSQQLMSSLEFVNLEPFNSIPFVQLTGDQTAAMIKVAAKPPPERMAQSKLSRPIHSLELMIVMAWRSKLKYEALPKVKSWNIEINSAMMKVEARVLPPPAITYGGNKTLRAAFG